MNAASGFLRISLAMVAIALCGCGPVKDINPLHGLGGNTDVAIYNFEDGTVMAFGDGGGSVSAAPGSFTQVYNTNQVSLFGDRALGLQLTGFDNTAAGRAAVEVALALPTDLTGKTVNVFIWTPVEFGDGDSAPSNGVIYLKTGAPGYGFASAGGNITAGGWSELSLSVEANPGPVIDEPFHYVTAGFDPTNIIAVGIKMEASGAALPGFKFNGSIFIDSLTW